MIDSTEREEREWQSVVASAGLTGVIWAVIRLLLKKQIITLDDLRDQITTEAADRMFGRR